MPKEKYSLLRMFRGEEPGPIARILHNLFDGDEGNWGEKCIEKLLKRRIPGVSLFKNVYVPIKGRTTELDIVMVAQTGIYIFESKAYGGKIYGNPDHINWVQYIGGKKYSFYNPVKQNENHCRCLSYALLIPRNAIFSFVVFENRTDLSKLSLLEDEDFIVCNRNQLLQLLTNILQTRISIFNNEQIANICSQFEKWSNPDISIKQKHIQDIENIMFGDVCPVCGNKLVERKGKYGAFIGCLGYPNCTYTREK